MGKGFDWRKNPEELQLVLRHVESNRNAQGKARRQVYDLIAQELETKTGREFTVPSIQQKLNSLAQNHGKKDGYKTEDLWEHGVNILKLDEIFPMGWQVIPWVDPKAGRNSAMLAKSLKKKRKSTDETDQEYVPGGGKRQKLNSDDKRKDEKEIEDSDSQEEGEEDEDEEQEEEINEPSDQSTPPVSISDDDTQGHPQEEQDLEAGANNQPVGTTALARHSLMVKLQVRPDSSSATANLESQIAQPTGNTHIRAEPFYPLQPPEETSIRDTMQALAKKISETVDAALLERGIDGSQPFYPHARCYHDGTLEVFEKVFGAGWSPMYLMSRISEAQNYRTLTLRTFLESFIGASVTLNALEVLPQEHVQKSFTIQSLVGQLLPFFKEGSLQASDPDKITIDKAHRYVVRSHILKRVVPHIDEKADQLAIGLQTQIQMILPAKEDSRWSCIVPHLCPSERNASTSRNQLIDDDYPITTADSRAHSGNKLYKDLKQIFQLALSERADWEAWGGAIFDFKFQQFFSVFKADAHCSNEDQLDTSKKHRIFVSILPGVWAQYRDNPASQWKQQRCITKGLVFLMGLRSV